MRVFVQVSEIPSSNRSYQEQVDGVWKGSGALRISVAHRNPRCMKMARADRDQEHSQVVEVPPAWLEHDLFRDLSTCSHCFRDDPATRDPL
jgi:hypothetical protein